MRGFLFFFTAALLTASAVQAANFSFRGTFDTNDDVQLFSFTIDMVSPVAVLTYSYSGGTMADGTVVEAGGFDPILTLFDSKGFVVINNDDGFFLGPDPNTGSAYDAVLSELLRPGKYTVALTKYDNFGFGSRLSDDFFRSGGGNFTPGLFSDCGDGAFCDVSGLPAFNQRSNEWAVDILNVTTATTLPVPLPATLPHSLAGLGTMALLRRLRPRRELTGHLPG